MKQLAANIISLLTPTEKKKAFLLVAADALASIADIGALACLLLIISSTAGQQPAWPPLQQHTPAVMLLFFGLFSLKNWLAFLIRKKQVQFSYSVAARLSEAQLEQYLLGSYTGYSRTDSSVHIRQISQAPVEFAHYVLGGMQQIATQCILATIALAAITWFNAGLLLLVLLVLLPAALLAAGRLRKTVQRAREQTRLTSEKTMQHLNEALAGFTESRVYGLHNYFTRRYTGWQQQLNRQLSGLQVIQLLPARLIEVFAVAALMVLVLAGKNAGNAAAADVLTIGAFMAAAYRIMPALVHIVNNRAQVNAYAHTVTALLENKAAIQPLPTGYGGHPLARFEQVSCGYGSNDVIRNLSFEIQPGEMVGITGSSGKGKTTVFRLLLGLITPSAGSVAVNPGTGGIAVVPQQPFLIHGSLLENIVLSDAQPDEERLAAAIRAAGLEPFTESLPGGIQGLITEKGKNISGGQQQRIVIARALYRNAGLLLLDEPFNELDEASEKILLAHFKALAAEGRIVIIATHNPASLAMCSRVIDLHA